MTIPSTQTLFIDVGGSNSKVYRLNSKMEIELNESKKTPRSANKLSLLLISIASRYKLTKIEIGLPGPIFGGESEIYMPPLGYSIDIFKLKNEFMSLNVFTEFYNDCTLLHKLAKYMPQKDIFKDSNHNEAIAASICISIGTSFGINGITETGSSLSLEMAHIPWFHLNPSMARLGKNVDFFKSKVCDVMNSTYLLASLEECQEVGEVEYLGQSFCDALLTAAQITASLLGINKFQLIVVTGIYQQIERLLLEVNIKKAAEERAKGLTKLSICPQKHFNIKTSL